MNITFVLPDGLTLGGVTTWSVEMCRRLTEMGKSVVLIEHPGCGPKLDVELPSEARVVSCASLVHPPTERDIACHVPAYRSALPGVFIPNWSFSTYAACAAIARDTPTALRIIGFAHTDESDCYQWLVHYEPIIHLFVAVSEEIAATLTRLLPHREPDIVVRPYGVNALPFLVRNYSLSQQPLQLVYAGRLSERQKRVSDLVRLANALEQGGVNFQLRIMGDGNDKEMLRRKIQALDQAARQRVWLEKSLPPNQMPEVLRSADISILVSEYEGTSIVMLEAMAQGCVPVVTRVSGTERVIRPGVNGFLAPVGDVAEMVRIIKALDDDRSRLAKLGEKAHATIVEGFSYDEYLWWFLKTADQVWQQLPRPWPTERLLPPRLAPDWLYKFLQFLSGYRFTRVFGDRISKYIRNVRRYVLED